MQLLIWLFFYFFMFLYNTQRWDYLAVGFWSTTIAVSFYVIAVYTNALYLIPRFYKTGSKPLYYLFSLLFLCGLFLLRVFIEYKFLYNFHPKLFGLTSYHFTFSFLTTCLAFLFGALLQNTIAYTLLLKKQDEMQSYQIAAELNLLKSQVQPHFLFNTLNNIYYLAYTKSDKTPEIIAKLSDIMRYFLDEAPKEKVPLSTEINFLKNYIKLESIRMLNPVKLDFSISVPDTDVLIPPMLLIPLVENIFKHGVDKTLKENAATINFYKNDGYFVFITENKICNNEKKEESRVGLINLKKGCNYYLITILSSIPR